MKKLLSLLVILAAALYTNAQNSSATINVTGNRIKQIKVDGSFYTINNAAVAEEKMVVVNDLTAGEHSLEIYRGNQYGNNPVTIKKTFTARAGYDLTIDIANDGSVSMTEKRTKNQGNAGNNQKPINATAFNKLYNSTKAKTSSASRSTFLGNEFTNTNKRFTSKQASKLIQLVNSESLRLKLAKQVYVKVTDRENFSLVINLLNSTANRNDLNSYIASLPSDDEEEEDGTVKVLSNEDFITIYNEVNAETSSSDRNYYLANFFSKDFNYYTSSQAKQLIQLISSQPDRLSLSKTAYRGITDRANYSLVSQLLNSSYDRSELQAYINTYDNSNPRNAISLAEFNKLYQDIYNQSTTARYNSIMSTFNTANYYFTATQARQLVQLVQGESSRLALAKASYAVLVDKTNYTQLNDLLSLQSSRTDLYNFVNGYATATAMTDAEFNNLYDNVRNAYSSSRVSMVTTAFNAATNIFTTYQVKQLLYLISTESDRYNLAKNAYDNLVDKASFNQLSDVLSNSVYKNDLAKFYSEMQNGGVAVVYTPMTDAEFNKIYKDVQFTFGLGAKMSALTDIFNNQSYMFTVAQAKQLIQLVSSESNRLELAKLSYNNVTDPLNFSQLYTIFSSQSSKDELAAYVSGNAYINN